MKQLVLDCDCYSAQHWDTVNFDPKKLKVLKGFINSICANVKHGQSISWALLDR